MELCDDTLRVSVVSVAGRCRRHRDEPRHEHDENQSHPYRRWRHGSQETVPRLGDEREETSVGSDQRNHRHERSIGRASVDHEIRSKHSAASASLMSAILNVKTFPSELTAHEIALDEWQENILRVVIDFWRQFQSVNEESSLP